jgi:Tol biopolymer transport system component
MEGFMLKTITLVSTDSKGNQGDDGSSRPSVSADGRFVAFDSNASNLIPGGDTDGEVDVFVKDIRTGKITLVSTNGMGFDPSISADGRLVAFTTTTAYAPGDTNNDRDVYVKDLKTGQIKLVSGDATGNVGSGESSDASISADGRFVAFSSNAALVPGDTNNASDVYVKNLKTGEVTLVSADADGNPGEQLSATPSISADGRFVVFTSLAPNLVPDDDNNTFDVFVKDLKTGEVTLVSADANGNQGNDFSDVGNISADGRFVSFFSAASNLVPDDTNGFADVFVKDLKTGKVTLVSTDANGVQGDGDSDLNAISADGRFVVFSSIASNLVPDDTNNSFDVFVKDLKTGNITLVSADAAGNEGDNASGSPTISADGSVVVFDSSASNLAPGGDANSFLGDVFAVPNNWEDLFL